MPATAQGLTEGDTEVFDSFESALEEKGITGGGKSGALSVTNSIVEATAPAPAPVEDTAATEDPEEGEAEPLHEDPDIAALLAKYDGDPDKALKAAVELQRKLGEQGNELGTLRQTVAKLEGAVEQIGRTPVQAAAPAVQLSGEQIDEFLGEYGGFETAKWAVNNAPGYLDTVLQKWAAEGSEESFLANKFDRQYQDWLKGQEAASKGATPSESDAYVAEQKATDLMTDVLTEVAGEFEDYEAFKAYVPAALEAVPKHLAAAIVSDDREVKAEGVKDLYERAQRLAAADAGKDASAAAAAKSIAGKQTARVIQGQSGTPATPKTPAGEATSREDQEAAFKRSILSADTTSVSDGLTYAKA